MQGLCGRCAGWVVSSAMVIWIALLPLICPAQEPSAYRMRATFSGYTQTAALTNLPVLILLSEDRQGFRYSQFASPDGHDLRFYDVSLTHELAYEVESWDTNGTSCVWVRIPCLSNSSDSVWICWGDAAQTNQPAYTLDGTVWSEDYRLVLHMGDSQDASTNQAAGTSSNVAFDGGRIGDAGRFNGTSSMLTFGHSNVLKPASQITISAWVKPSGPLLALAFRTFIGRMIQPIGICWRFKNTAPSSRLA